jgi:uncharacterized membrane protein
MNRELKLAVIAFVTVLALFVVWQPLIMKNNDNFSELLVLGPNQNLSGYPNQVNVSQRILLYAFVYNHEGKVEYYQLVVKLGNQSTLVSNEAPANAIVIITRQRIVQEGGNYTFPLMLSLNSTGINERIIFELWDYDPSASNFRYMGIWNEIWLNVTSS